LQYLIRICPPPYRQEGDIIAVLKAGFSKTEDDALIRLALDFQYQKEQVEWLWFDSPKFKK